MQDCSSAASTLTNAIVVETSRSAPVPSSCDLNADSSGTSSDGAVVIRTARSQSRRSMDKKDFQASKSAVLDIVAGMIGVAPEDLARQAA